MGTEPKFKKGDRVRVMQTTAMERDARDGLTGVVVDVTNLAGIQTVYVRIDNYPNSNVRFMGTSLSRADS